MNVLGGGIQTSVTGNTSVKIGDAQDDLGVTVQGVVYGGGHGENSEDITVTGNSNVKIEGKNTTVESYENKKTESFVNFIVLKP